MSPFATVRSAAQAAIEEIVANATVRQRFPAFVLGQAQDLFTYANDKAHVKGELQKLLKLGSPDPAAVHRGLLIQLNGVFEGFIKSLVSTHISQIASRVSRFDELEPSLQTTYAAHAAPTTGAQDRKATFKTAVRTVEWHFCHRSSPYRLF